MILGTFDNQIYGVAITIFMEFLNVIERVFGVVKACFPILKRTIPYSFTTQTKIVMACFSIHNFLRQISISDTLFSEYENEVQMESDNAN